MKNETHFIFDFRLGHLLLEFLDRIYLSQRAGIVCFAQNITKYQYESINLDQKVLNVKRSLFSFSTLTQR